MKGSLKIWMVILGILAAGTGITCLTNTYVTRQIAKMAETEPHRQEYMRVLPEEESADRGQGMAEDALPEAIEEGAPAGILPEGEDFASAGEAPEAAKVFDKEQIGEDAGDLSAAGNAEELPQADKAEAADIGQAPLAERAVRNSPADEAVLEIAEYPTDLQEGLKEYRERFPQIDRQIEQMRKSETENNVYSVKTAAQTEQRIWEREMEGIYRLLCDSLDAMACEKLKKEQQEWVQLRDSLAEEAAKKNSGGSLESVDYIASIASSNRERAYALLEKYQE